MTGAMFEEVSFSEVDRLIINGWYRISYAMISRKGCQKNAILREMKDDGERDMSSHLI